VDEPGHDVRLVRASFEPLLLTPIRVGVALVALLAAGAVGVRAQSAALSFVMGAFLTAFVLANDRRHLLFGPRDVLDELPARARVERWWEVAVQGIVPSTVGVAVLAGISLAFSTVLTSVLAGVEAGMGLAGLIAGIRLAAWERRLGGRLYVERGRGRLFLAASGRDASVTGSDPVTKV
jgi:hypothetical protein